MFILEHNTFLRWLYRKLIIIVMTGVLNVLFNGEWINAIIGFLKEILWLICLLSSQSWLWLGFWARLLSLRLINKGRTVQQSRNFAFMGEGVTALVRGVIISEFSVLF